MFKVGIIGASGFTGYELIKILSKHPAVELNVLNSESHAGKPVKSEYPECNEHLIYTNYSIEQINSMDLDCIFLAVPNQTAMMVLPKLKAKVIDLSADYRFSDKKVYESVYQVKHIDKKTNSVYGLPELFKDRIKKAHILANPGCYATGMILSAYPLQQYAKYIIFDGKSGWSGAGKLSSFAKEKTILQNNLQAYKIAQHRHKYEVEQFIKTKLSFSPHVFDIFRGMMITTHVLLKKEMTKKKVIDLYKKQYVNAPFVEITESIPDIKQVQNTNKCIIGGFEIDENNQLVIVAVLDNLLKGASGQAVQNMNLMLGLKETEGLQ